MSTIKANQWLNSDGTENYKCRAWVNFNGTGTIAIRASGNVSSITDGGVGVYTVNFTNAMSDVNYSTNATSGSSAAGTWTTTTGTYTTTGVLVACVNYTGTLTDTSNVSVAVFR